MLIRRATNRSETILVISDKLGMRGSDGAVKPVENVPIVDVDEARWKALAGELKLIG